MLLEAIIKTIASLRLARVWKVMLLSALITIMLFGVMVATIAFILGAVDFSGWAWLSWVMTWLGSGAALFLSFVLFPITLPIITSLFLDYLAGGVEQHYYPKRAGQDPAIVASILSAIALFGTLLLVNLLILPLYIVPVLNVFLYFIVNGYLMGREFFELIALRHLKRNEARDLRGGHRIVTWLAGVLIAVAAVTPILNLFAPVLSTVLMVHLYHSITKG